MEILKKRSTAFIVALIVLVLSVLLGSSRSLRQLVSSVENQFYDGVYDQSEDYTKASIYSQLNARITTALKIVSVGTDAGYSDTDLADAEAALRNARGELLSLLEDSAGPKALYAANQNLSSAAEKYYNLLQPLLELGGSDQTDNLNTLESAYSSLSSAQRVIDESGYNEAVQLFNRTVLGKFPANILKIVTFVSAPELFA